MVANKLDLWMMVSLYSHGTGVLLGEGLGIGLSTWIHPRSLTACPWRMKVGRWSFPFGMAYFQGRTVKLPGSNLLSVGETDKLVLTRDSYATFHHTSICMRNVGRRNTNKIHSTKICIWENLRKLPLQNCPSRNRAWIRSDQPPWSRNKALRADISCR